METVTSTYPVLAAAEERAGGERPALHAGPACGVAGMGREDRGARLREEQRLCGWNPKRSDALPEIQAPADHLLGEARGSDAVLNDMRLDMLPGVGAAGDREYLMQFVFNVVQFRERHWWVQRKRGRCAWWSQLFARCLCLQQRDHALARMDHCQVPA
jgi:hypothetical protein